MIRGLLLRCLPSEWRRSIEGDLNEEATRRRGSRWTRELWKTAHVAAIVVALAGSRLAGRLQGIGGPTPSRWLGDAMQDTRHGLRRWSGRPAFTAAAIATVALGIGTTSALFSIVDGVLLKPLPYPAQDRLVTVNRTYPEWVRDPILSSSWDRISLAWPEFFHIRERSRTIEALAVATTRLTILGGGHAQELRVGVASASFFSMLGARPRLGGFFALEDDVRDPGSTVISHNLWQTRFGGDPAIVGRTIQLEGGDRVVAGVLPADFRWGGRQFPYHLWFPLSAIPEAERLDNNRNLDAIARLRPGVTLADATGEMSVLLREHFRFSGATGGLVTPFFQRQLRRVRTPLLILLAGAVLLLVIACANVAGLLTSDASSREGEIAVRASLGATGGRVFRQLLAEGLLLSAAGAAAGLLVALWGLRALVALAPIDLPRVDEIGVDVRVVAFATLAAVLTSLLFGVLPALSFRRSAPADRLRGASRTVTSRRRAASALALVEIALGVALLAGAGLFIRSLTALQGVNAGFDRSNLLTLRAWLPPTRYPEPERATRFFEDAQSALRSLPGVTDAAVSSSLAFATGRASTTITLAEPQGGRPAQIEAQRRFVSPDYFRTMRLSVLGGRTFDSTDRAGSPPVAVVSREMERRFWPEGAIGRRFTYAKAEHTVIGVVNDVRDLALDLDTQATFYLSTTQRPAWSTMRLILRTAGEPSALAAPARAALARIDPDVPIEDVSTMDELVSRSTDDERYRTVLMGVFAVAAALLAGVGLYSTLARRVADRQREIAVRLALGARPEQVRRLFLGEGLRLAAGGAALGVPLALALGRSASTLLFGISPADPLTLVTVVVAIATLAVIATYIPSARASRLDPVEALRAG